MISLLLRVVVVSLSGALAPGPLTAATASAGLKRGWSAGLATSVGHTLVELPLVILLALGVAAIFQNPAANFVIGLVGSVFLFAFGVSMIRDKENLDGVRAEPARRTPTPLVTGLVLTGLNPYFLAWWVGIGTPLINDALKIAGFGGVALLYLFHVWLDYAWLTFIAGLASVGQLKTAVYRWLLIVLGAAVIGFGANLLIKTIGSFLTL
jgi:threonine/homoserine/homoserine lactone efflux protein